MKRIIIIIAIISAIFLRSDKSYAQGFLECMNCCTVVGQGQNQCRVVCTETTYTMMLPMGTQGCNFPPGPGWTATLIGTSGSFCRYEVVFNTPGTFNINGFCFIVLAHPQAIIGNSNPLYVCKGTPVGFINNSLNATDYVWNFGDTASGPLNTSVSSNNIDTHTYNTPGTYIVTLIASASITTNSGTHECCRDTTQITVIVDSGAGPSIECLSPVCDNTPGTYCITNNPGGCTYTWSTNPPNTVTPAGNCATFNWTTEPLGSIILTASGAGCCPYPNTFYVPIMPSGTFNINGNTTVCSGSVEFYNAPVIWGANYNWSISPSVPFTIPNPANPSQIAVQWPTSGSFTITCNMTNDVLDCEATGTLNVTIQPSFNISGPSDTCVNTPVTFTSTASGTTNWTVTPAASCTGSGNTFNCTFTNPGVYTISATAPGYCNNPVTTIIIHPQPAAPVVTGPSQVMPGCTYTYTATGTGNISWNVLPNTAVVVNAGNTIQVTWPSNLTTGVVQAFVTQNNCPSLPGEDSVFAIPQPTISLNDTVCSNGQSSHSISSLPPNTTVNWTVTLPANGSVTAGQGTASVTIDWYTVSSPTNATITATIMNSCTNTPFATLTTNVLILPAPPVAVSGNLLFCSGSSTTMTATGGPAYSWDGVGGGPTQSFSTAGQHYVEINVNGCTNKKYFTLVEVPGPSVTLSTTAPVTCSGNTPNSFTLATTTAPGYTVTNYTFTGPGGPLCSGPSPTCFVGSPANGTYTVAVTFSYTYNGNPVSCTRTASITINCLGGNNNGGCTDNPLGCQYSFAIDQISCDSIELTINPNPPCGNFTNPSANITLNWGDGNTVNLLPFWDPGSQTYILTHAYGLPGIYHPFLSCGLGDTSIVVGGAVDFSLVRDSCAVDLLDFSTATAGNSFTFANVNWGDGNIDTFKTHTYVNGGTYNVTLSYLLNGDTCKATKTITIVKPDITINASPNPACVGAPVNFTINYNAPFTAADAAFYNWDFGDTSAPAQNDSVQHSYTSSGTKMVILTVTDIYGCSASDTLMLTVVDPVAYTVSSNSPQCDSVIMTIVTPSGFGNPTGVTWTPPTNSLGSFQYSADSTGLYTAVITGPNGCNITVATNIVVFPPPNVQIFVPDSTCNPGLDTFTTSASPAQFTFNWQITGITNAFSQSGSNPEIVFGPGASGIYEVALTVTSVSAPFCSATVKDTVQVFDGPAVSVSPNTFGPVCAGTPIIITATPTGSGPFTYGWNSGQTTAVITTYTNGLYTVTVTDVNNCTAQGNAFANISPLPDFTVFVRGCDTLCFNQMDTIHGPVGYANYEFLIDNNTVQNGTTTFLADPCGQPLMSDGQPHTIKLIITTSVGCIDSSEFELKCETCDSCACTDSIQFSTSPYVSYIGGTDSEQKITDSSKCDNNTTPLNVACNKKYQFAIGFNIPAGYDSCKVQDSAVLTDNLGNVLATQVPTSNTSPLSFTFTQDGVYCVTHYLTVNGKVCKTCVMCVQVSCPKPPPCTNCPDILNSASFTLDTLVNKDGYQLQAAYVNFSTISSFQELSISIADIEYSFNDSKCQDCKMKAIGRGCIYPNSATQTVGTLVLDSNGTKYLPIGSKPNECPEVVTWIPGTAATANSYNVPVQISLPAGLISSCCSLKISKLCLRIRIKNLDCEVCDTVICYKVPAPCCKGGKWETKSVTASGTNSNVVTGPNQVLGTTSIVCGYTYTVNKLTTYSFNANYLCAIGCNGVVKVRITKPDNTTTTNNTPVNKTFNQVGIYKVTYLAYCGNVVCDSCTYFLEVKKDCCEGSKWNNKQITIVKPNNTLQTKVLNNGSSHNTNGPATVNLSFQCADECMPSYSWKRWRNGVLLDSASIAATTSAVNITFSKPPSCDSIVITAYCDGKPCATLSFKLCCQPCGSFQGSNYKYNMFNDMLWFPYGKAEEIYLAGSPRKDEPWIVSSYSNYFIWNKTD